MMKSLLPALTLTLLSPLVIAQTTPSQTNPPREPSSSMQDPSTDGTANYSNGSGDDKAQMKACIAKQKQTNPDMSQDEIKRICENKKPKGEENR